MSKYVLKINPSAGAAGDMCLSAFYSLYGKLIDNGLIIASSDLINAKLEKLVKKLGSEFELKIDSAERLGICGTRIYLDYTGHKSHSHHVTYQKLSLLIKEYNEEGFLSQEEAQVASQILLIIAKAEAISHEVSLEKVHFHEIGEEDSIFDIIANGIILSAIKEAFGDFNLYFNSPVEVGHGYVDTSHGKLEIPAPATKNIIDAFSLEITKNYLGECLTPTGAAILSYLKSQFLNLLEVVDVDILANGIGCGSLNPNDRANILSVELGVQK